MEEMSLRFEGRVQGVGFRWTVIDYAEKYHLKGTVRNLPGGAVEAIVQGELAEIEAFLEAIEQNPAPAQITSIKKENRTPSKLFEDFQIVY